jgi:hypothetical protein
VTVFVFRCFRGRENVYGHGHGQVMNGLRDTAIVTINRQHCHVCSGDLRTRAVALTDVVRVRYVARVQIA